MQSTPRPILAFMQNQWFHRPDKVRADLDRYADNPERQRRLRRRMIEYALFAGCKSGRVLKKILGEDLCDQTVWEEASREIGGHAASVFPADLPHMRAVIAEVEPTVIVAFGKIAGDALRQIETELDLFTGTSIYAPHPAARHPTAMTELAEAALAIRTALKPAPIEVDFL